MSTPNTEKRPEPAVLIFDIETVPDIPLFLSVHGKENTEDDWKNLELYTSVRDELKISFPQTIFHTVVSICGIFVEPETYRIMDGFKKTLSLPQSYEELRQGEKELLEAFWAFSLKYENIHSTWYDTAMSDRFLSDYQKKRLKKIPVVFSGYNISSFDLPVIEQRSIIHGITCPLDDYAKNLGSDSYRYKYAQDKVFDLLNFVSNFDNRNARIALDTFSKALGLSGKWDGMDGGQVESLFYSQNKKEIIEEYCSIDVLITYATFLAIQKYRGLLSEDKYSKIKTWFHTWLLRDEKPMSYKALALNSKRYFGTTEQKASETELAL